MHTASFGAPCATGDAARSVPPQPGVAVSYSADVEAEKRRLRNAIANAYARKEKAERHSDFETKIGALDDIERLEGILARISVGV